MTVDSIQSLQGLSTLVLALSAANERLIEAIKNLLAPWLAKEKTTDGATVDPVKDRWRQLAVQVTSFLLATCVAAWIATNNPFAWGAIYKVKAGDTDVLQVSALMLGLLTCGGSAFWNSMLDFTRAAAKLREQKTDTVRLLNDRTTSPPGAAAALTTPAILLKV